MSEQTKWCPRCQAQRPVSEFYVNRRTADGLSGFCVEHQREAGAATALKLRSELLALLGESCVRCGFDDQRALQVDHVNGSGAMDRRTTGQHRHHRAFVERVRANRSDYQLLCANCNGIKRIEDGEHVGHRVYPRKPVRKITHPRSGRQGQANTAATTKHCPKCDITKAVSDFVPNRARSDGLSSWCRQCITEIGERVRRATRDELLSLLGGECRRCGFTDARALQVDHVHGGGSQERKTVWSSTRSFIERVRSMPGEYQLLCANCNWIKRIEEDEHRRDYTRTRPSERKKGVGKGRAPGQQDGLRRFMAEHPDSQAERSREFWENVSPEQKAAFKAKMRSIATGRKLATGPDGKRHWVHPEG